VVVFAGDVRVVFSISLIADYPAEKIELNDLKMLREQLEDLETAARAAETTF